MIVHHVLWPVLVRRFENPRAPAWFHQRVRAEIRNTVSENPSPREACISVVILLALLAVMLLHMAGLSVGLSMVEMLFISIWLLLGIWAEIKEARVLLRSGQEEYDALAEIIEAHLTAHERMDYFDHTR